MERLDPAHGTHKHNLISLYINSSRVNDNLFQKRFEEFTIEFVIFINLFKPRKEITLNNREV